LVIDGNVKVAGKVPSKQEITDWIEEKEIAYQKLTGCFK